MRVAEVLLPVSAELGEGPTWLVDENRLAWVDILRGEIHRSALDGTDRTVTTLGVPVGALAVLADGSLAAAVPDGLRRLDGSLLASIPVEAPDLRMNDGTADPAGRFVGGTMTLGEPRPGAGSLWSIDGDGAHRLLADLTISNGLGWSADATTLHFIDTPTQGIDVCDYDPVTGALTDRRRWVSIDPDLGAPDGLCVDAEGGVWVALWGGSAVHRYADGHLTEIIEVPTPNPTCPTFAGPDLDLLVITTASIEHGPVDGAGHLYVARPGTTGTPPNRLGAWAN